MDLGDQTTAVLFQRNEVIAKVWPDAKEAGDLILLVKMINLLRKRQVS